MLPLLRTKIAIPPLRLTRLERQRLVEQICEGARRTLTVVVAPAGFGKTTLVAEWARSTHMPVAWLSLERTDSPPERFLSYLIHSLQQISPETGRTAFAMLHSAQAVAGEAILVSLINDLSEIPHDFAMVLDDFHSLDAAGIQPILQSLLEHSPAHLHLVIASRTMPEFSLARLRARDQVVEVNASDLRFNEAEVEKFLEQMGASLPPDQLRRLNQFTEGWAAGLQLAGLALARQPSAWDIPAGQAHIFDYLAEEVLRRESPPVQQFLQVSALFDRFCLPLCKHLLVHGAPPSENETTPQAILQHVERANLFLVPLDSTHTWFRYHALFAEFLRPQLSTELAREYYRLASLWFEEKDLLDEAIHYATHAADYHRAADLLETHYLDLIQRGEQSALMEWLTALPPSLMDEHPRLWLAKGWCSIIGFNSVQAEACAQKAEALIPPGESGDRFRGEAKSLRILTGIFSGRPAVADEISEAFILLAEQDDLLHTVLHFNLALHHTMLGNTAQALEAFAETIRLARLNNNPLVCIVAQVQSGEVRQMRGALGLAERTFQQVIQYAQETLGEHTFLLGMPYVSYADLLREQNRFEQAIHYAGQGIAYCQMWQPMASMDGQIALARIYAAQGNWGQAEACLDQATQVARASVSILDDSFVAVQKVHLELMRGNLPGAQHLINAHDLEKDTGEMYYHLQELVQLVLLRARVLAFQAETHDPAPLLEALSSLIAEAHSRERVTPVIEALILKAYIQHAAGQHAAAAESLTHALTTGAQSGYLRIFADEGKPLLHILEQYPSQLHAPRLYVEGLLQILRSEAGARLPSPASQPGDLVPLTRRELDILQLLAAGKSNQEIAQERVLTLNTVKKHVANILSKLGVANRTQAVILARQRGWLEAEKSS